MSGIQANVHCTTKKKKVLMLCWLLTAVTVRFLQLITGKKKKKLRLNISESDEDIPPRKQKSHTLSSDSDVESYDTSSSCDKEPLSWRPYKKKGMPHKKIPSLSKRIPDEQKGIVWFSDM